MGKQSSVFCVRVLALAAVTKATFYQQSEDTSGKGGQVGVRIGSKLGSRG